MAVMIGNQSRQTAALWLMIVDTAHFAPFARGKFLAWILTFAVYARLIGRAFGVTAAAKYRAGNTRIASVARRTFTHGIVIDAEAFGTLTARSAVGSACRHALAIDA